MIETKAFDEQIAKTEAMVSEVQSKTKTSSEVLDQIAEAASIGDVDFDIENARIKDVLAQQKTMEANIADLIIGLEDVTNSFGSQFENMQGFSLSEKVIGIFSKTKAQAMRNDRVRTTSLAGNLQDLLGKSNVITKILQEQKAVLSERYQVSEESLKKVISRRQQVTEDLKTTPAADRGNEPGPAGRGKPHGGVHGPG